MRKIDIPPLPSSHSPESIWTALNTPVPPELVGDIVSSKVSLSYENLGGDGKIQQGTRLLYVFDLEALRLLPENIRKKFPEEVGLVVGDMTSDRTRTDVIEDGQLAQGEIRYAVKDGEGVPGLLVVEGELAIEGLGALFPSSLAEPLAVEHGIRNPAERLLAHVPQLLAASQ